MAKSAVRLQVVQVGVFAAMALLAVGAAQVQLREGRRWAEEAQAQRTERIVLQARRGTLSDRHGTPLALTQETYHVGVAPNELRDPGGDGAVIARQLGLSATAWQQALRKRYADFAGPFSAPEVQPPGGRSRTRGAAWSPRGGMTWCSRPPRARCWPSPRASATGRRGRARSSIRSSRGRWRRSSRRRRCCRSSECVRASTSRAKTGRIVCPDGRSPTRTPSQR